MTVNSHEVIMWTAQTREVCDVIARESVSYVKQEYIRQKYKETAWIFQLAYRFFARNFVRCVEKPGEAQSPVWLFKDPKWTGGAQGAELLKVCVPAGQMLFFDRRRWGQILNLSYVGTEEERRDFEKRMYDQGIGDVSEIFMKPYYPFMKSEILKSWDRVFETDGLPEQDLQGAVWCLRKEWLL